jgi:hypothetical protein
MGTLYNRKGQAFLALVFLIGGIIATIALTLAIIILSSLNTSYGTQASEAAEATATAGVEDALLQLARSNTFSKPGGYNIQEGSNVATVTVTQNSPSSGEVTVFSSATVSSHIRKINVVLAENSMTGQASIISWADVQ